jgi:hypothetical protein
MRARRLRSQPRNASLQARCPRSQPAAATSGTPALPESCELKPSLRARKPHQGQVFLGSPCISSLALGFRTPLIPLLPVWEKGDEGQTGTATEWSSLRDDRVSGAPSPVAGIPPGARRRRAHPGHLRFQRQVFWQAPAFLLSLWASGRPDSPFSPCGSLGADRTGVSHACCFLRLRPAGAHACRPGRCGAPGWRRVGRTANTRSTNLVHRRGPTPR